MASSDTAAAETPSSLPGLWPLPLTPFESYMIADDQPDYPMTFVVRLQFDGCVERETFATALAIALARNPLLTARVDDRDDPCWVAGEITPWLDFGPDTEPLTGGCARPIDPHHEPGLRTWVRVGDDTSRIIFQFHHACCDGIGAFHFVEDLLVAYANEHDGSGLELRPLDIG